MPEVSVIIPTFGRSHMIFTTIESVVKQTYSDLEILVVNDGECDREIRDIIDLFADNRIHYLRNHSKKGANGARNTGFKNAKGNFIAFLDDDDIWYPQKIEKQIIKFNKSSEDVGLIYSGFEIASSIESKLIKIKYPEKSGYVLKDILYANFIGSPTPLIKKKIFSTTGIYDENLESAQDWDLWIRIADKTYFEFVDEILARYIVHGDQISVDFNKKIRSMEYILRKFNTLYSNNKKAHANMHKKIAVLEFMNGRRSESRKRILKALSINFFQTNLIAHLLISFIPSAYRHYIVNFLATTSDDITLVY
jgi:glycosyltransferase involved in cell wall biosynthesis